MSLQAPDPRRGCDRALVDRDECGPITAAPAGLFTAIASPSVLRDRDDLGRRLADWVTAELRL